MQSLTPANCKLVFFFDTEANGGTRSKSKSSQRLAAHREQSVPDPFASTAKDSHPPPALSKMFLILTTRPEIPPPGQSRPSCGRDRLRSLTELSPARRRTRFPTSSASNAGCSRDPRRPHPRRGPTLPFEVAWIGEVVAQPRQFAAAL